MRKKDLFRVTLSYILTFIVIVLLVAFLSRQREQLEILRSISWEKLIIPILLGFITLILSNIQYYYYLKKKNNVIVDNTDLLTLSASMALVGYIFPLKGGLLYSLLLYKYKYNVNYNSGISVGLFMYFITFVFSGLYCIYFSYSTPTFQPIIFIIGLILTASPLFLIITHKILNAAHLSFRHLILNSTVAYVSKIVGNIKDVLSDLDIVLVIFVTRVFKILITCLWYLSIIKLLGLDYSFSVIILFVLLRESVMILKITPGNIGVDELLIGSVSSMLGGLLTDGIIISLLVRGTMLISIIPIGTWGMLKNHTYLKNKILNNKLNL